MVDVSIQVLALVDAGVCPNFGWRFIVVIMEDCADIYWYVKNVSFNFLSIKLKS